LPSALNRLRWSRHEVVASIEATDPAVVARTFVYLFTFGATLAALVPLFPGVDLVWPPVLYAAVGLAYGAAGLALGLYDRSPPWLLRGLAPVGAILIAAAMASASAEVIPVYALLFFWVVLAAFYFYGLPSALADLGLVGVVYAGALAVRGGEERVALWLMSMATLGVTGVFLALLRKRADTLILSLDAAARTDSLTGLLNRRGFDIVAGDELERGRRTRRPCALLLVDVDEFKAINDRWGHPAGDAALEHLAAVLTRGRAIDRCARVGGDEFAVLLPETDAGGALRFAERVLAELREGREQPAAVGEPICVSVGVACFPGDGRDATALHESADVALYHAKQQGRGRAVLYLGEMDRAPTG
jgi:diguanylate cyclase (GGDEF)-like protein